MADTILKNALKKHFGFSTFKGDQEAIIQNVLDKKDTFVLMPTGGGKSLCYQLSSLMLEGTAIVVSPLIALMKNQVDAMRNFSDDDSVAHFLNSSLNKTATEQVKRDVLDGKTKLLYVAPETLTKESNVEFLKKVNISFYAVDEAHCISEWGHDFRPEYRRIRPIVNAIGTAPIIALTATATPKVQHDIQKTLGMLEAKVYKSSFNRDNLYYEIRSKKDVDKEIVRFIKKNEGKSGIIYCLSRKKVEELSAFLKVNGVNALAYHAGMDAAQRSKNQDAFLMEDVNIIVATIAFGMGIDKPDVRFVIHYDIPKSLEGYYQETGRAGRDGGEGQCVTFYSYKDIQKLEKFMHGKPVAEQEIGKQLLLETTAYAESSVCRRILLLHYFGEKYENENCGCCDNCLHPKTKFDAQDLMVKLLQVVTAVKDKFKAEHVVNILTENEDAAVKSYKHNELSVFGLGKETESVVWDAVVRQGLIAGYIDKEIENYGLLRVTPKGKEFILSPKEFMMTENHQYEDSNSGPAMGTSALDSTLFNILKDTRRKVGHRLGLPPFVIFQDPSLEAMATNYPITVEELQSMPGVGQGKAKRFGKEFVELIARYVEENDIQRPADLVIRSVADRSKFKIYLIQSIDRKMPLDLVASAKGMDMDTLLGELETIVFSGTKINIDYYINEVLDEDTIDDIFLYFKEDAENDTLKAALEELGEEDYEEEAIRLMRLKFFSEMGN